jgi:hypothetical protein
MIVVADTSPLNYLILIEQIHLLELLYGRVLVPHAVLDELLSPFARFRRSKALSSKGSTLERPKRFFWLKRCGPIGCSSMNSQVGKS